MLWVDKHRPKTLEELDLHPETTQLLTQLAATADMPHLLFHGPPGGGKKTRCMAVLHRVFGPGVLNLKLEHKAMQVSDSKAIEVTTLSSPFHIDVNPSDAGNYDRVLVMQMIRDIAATVPLGTGAAAGGAPRFKVVVLNEVDKMTRAAQQALRRTMERYMGTCRLVLLCSSASRLIAPLRSRCLSIRVPALGPDGVSKAALAVCTKEGVPAPSPAFLAALHDASCGNLRRALLMLEAAKMNKVDLAGDGRDIPQPDWRTFIGEIAAGILAQQTPAKLHELRLCFYELLSQCVPAETILRELTTVLLRCIAPPLLRALISVAASCDHSLKLGTRHIVHLEAFTASVMQLVKNGA